MTLIAIVDEEYAGLVATTSGWSEFIDWVEESLEAVTFPGLHWLIEHGYNSDLPELWSELNDARPANSDIAEVRDALLDAIRISPDEKKFGGLLIITDEANMEVDDDDEGEAKASRGKARPKKAAKKKAAKKKTKRP